MVGFQSSTWVLQSLLKIKQENKVVTEKIIVERRHFATVAGVLLNKKYEFFVRLTGDNPQSSTITITVDVANDLQGAELKGRIDGVVSMCRTWP